MKRTILSVAYPLAEVGADAVGGSEQILTSLDRTLTGAGHRSIVIAAAGSKIAGTLIESPATKKKLTDSVRAWGRVAHRRLIKEALATYPVDLVHMHALDFYACLPSDLQSSDVPVLATLHLPPDWYPPEIFRRGAPFFLNCVSRSQRQNCPPCDHLLEPVPNGVDVDRLDGEQPKGNFALALGRICPEKGFHFALDAARAAGWELLLAGEVFRYETHMNYFKEDILPRLDHERRFIGPLRFARKKRLLALSQCVLIPSTVPETSSLVAMEALACGTPVIAFPSGALPEIVDHGRTGFIVSSSEEMADALRKVHTIQPSVCRQIAHSRFSARMMGARYLSLYEQLIAAHSGHITLKAASV
jgi:glycosyltransferase involved in cell wall biosynthesis